MAKIYDIKSHRKTKSVNNLKKQIVNLVDLIADFSIDNPLKVVSLVMLLICVVFLACKIGIITTFMIVMLVFAVVLFCFDIFMGD